MTKIGMNKGLATAIAMALVTCVAVWFVLGGGAEKIARDEILKAEVNYASTLAYRLVRFDVENGIADRKAADRARANIGTYFRQVDGRCGRYRQARDFLLCANRVLGEYFEYEGTADATNTYAMGHSDCDLNAFLVMDAAAMHGVETSVMYTPGHALVTWAGEDGKTYYLETTVSDNRGKLADIKDTFYVRTNDDTYYTPYDDEAAFVLYQAVVYRQMADKGYIVGLFDALPDNTLVADSYYEYLMTHGRIGPDEIADITERLKTATTSETLSLILADWYLKLGDTDRALSVLGGLPPQFCTYDCIWLGIEAWADHLGYHEQGAQISDFYREYLKDWKIFESRQRIRYLLVTGVIGVLVVVIFVSVFLRRRFARKSCQR